VELSTLKFSSSLHSSDLIKEVEEEEEEESAPTAD
jgi:hypothetical protein